MDRDTELDLLRRFAKLHADRTTELAPEVGGVDPQVYLDPDRAAREREVLFRGLPLVAALSGDLPEPGTVCTVELGDVPVLLVRGEDTVVRAFVNACRHRGSRVAEGHLVPGRVLSCPFHAWTYDLNGDLLGQPLARDAFAGVERDETGLIPLPAGEAGGLVLVAPGATGEVDAAAWLGDLGHELAAWEFDGYRFFDERVVEVAANWKLVYDTFTEAYHVFSLHRRTVGRLLLSTPAIGDTFGDHVRSVVFGRSVPRMLREADEEDWDLKRNGSVVYQLFPNALVNMPQSGHAELWQVHPDPHDVGRCRVHLRMYSPGEVTDDRTRHFYETNLDFTHRVVLEEDFGQQEAIQRNLASGFVDRLLHGRNEAPLQHFHARLDAHLAGDA